MAEPSLRHHGSAFWNQLLDTDMFRHGPSTGNRCEQDRHGPHAQGPDVGIMESSRRGFHNIVGLWWCKHRNCGGGLYREGHLTQPEEEMAKLLSDGWSR